LQLWYKYGVIMLCVTLLGSLGVMKVCWARGGK